MSEIKMVIHCLKKVTAKTCIIHRLSDERTTLNHVGGHSQDCLPYLPCCTSKSVAVKIYMKYGSFYATKGGGVENR